MRKVKYNDFNDDLEEGRLNTERVFLQQNMRACRPNLSSFPTTCLIIFSAIHLVLALVIAFTSYGWRQMRIRYDDICSENATCNIQFNVSRQYKQPVYVYYELLEFYQTHYAFHNSIDYDQLAGRYVTSSQACTPKIYNEDGDILAPCGLRAYYTWRDEYSFPSYWDVSPATTWEHEKNILYKKLNNNYKDSQLWLQNVSGYSEGVLTDKFEIWMRASPQPHFSKLYSIIHTNIDPGLHNMTIKMLYPKSYYSKERYIVFIHQPFAGGRNLTLIGINALICVIFAFTGLMTACLNSQMVDQSSYLDEHDLVSHH